MQTAIRKSDCVLAGGEEQHGHGTKRKADDSSLADTDRFFKRFNLLNIGSSPSAHAISNLYVPVAKPNAPTATTEQRAIPAHVTTSHDGSMLVDDTPDRIYIHDLDAELAGEEVEEERLIFLPDIEKRLNRLPPQVLSRSTADEHENQELVLYGIPQSLTKEAGHESVRKAIIEARQRARDKAVEDARHLDMMRKYEQEHHHGHVIETAHGYGGGYELETADYDPDAMDMD